MCLKLSIKSTLSSVLVWPSVSRAKWFCIFSKFPSVFDCISVSSIVPQCCDPRVPEHHRNTSVYGSARAVCPGLTELQTISFNKVGEEYRKVGFRCLCTYIHIAYLVLGCLFAY